MFGYKPAQIRKFLVALSAFLVTVVAVVLEAAVGIYGDGNVSTGEVLALAVTAANAFGVFTVENEAVDPTPYGEVGEDVDYDLGGEPDDADHEMGMEGNAIEADRRKPGPLDSH